MTELWQLDAIAQADLVRRREVSALVLVDGRSRGSSGSIQRSTPWADRWPAIATMSTPSG
jgi:hypothetical protein